MTILQSLVESTPNSKNIKELVELLKKVLVMLLRRLNIFRWKETWGAKCTWSSCKISWETSLCKPFWSLKLLLWANRPPRKTTRLLPTLYDFVSLTGKWISHCIVIFLLNFLQISIILEAHILWDAQHFFMIIMLYWFKASQLVTY